MPIIHEEQSPFAGKIVRLKEDIVHRQYPGLGGSEFLVEDWQDRVMGDSWHSSPGNPAILIYAMRIDIDNPHVPADDEVVYGKYYPSGTIGEGFGFGCLIHINEIEEME